MCFQISPAVTEAAAGVVAKSMPNTERYSCQSIWAFSASFVVLVRSSARRVVSKLRRNSRYSLSVCGTEFAEAALDAFSRDATNLPFTKALSVAISSSTMEMSAFGHS